MARVTYIHAAWLAAVFGAGPADAAARTAIAQRFANGLVALVRADNFTDVGAVAARLGLVLRNPQKWSHQPAGGRNAGWPWPAGGAGVSLLRLEEMTVNDGAQMIATMTIELTGRPCLSVAHLERAAGARATFGGVAMMMVFDGPPQPPQALGDEVAAIEMRNRRDADVAISTTSSRPRRAGCVRALNVTSDRPAR